MFLVFLLTAASVFCLSLGVALLRERNPVLEMVAPSRKRREPARRFFLKELWRSDEDLFPVGVVSGLGAAAVSFGLTWFLPAALLAGALAFVFVPRLYARALAERRKAAFLQHLARCISGTSSVLRATGDFRAGLEYGAQSVPEPVRSEVLRMLEEIKSASVPVPEAARRLAERVDIEEVRVFSEGLALLADVGGPAGVRLLESTAEFLKERALLRRKVRVYTANVRLTFLIGSLFPFGLAGVMSLALAEYRAAFASPAGRLPLFLAAGFLVAGYAMVRRLIKGAEEVL